MSRVDLHPEDLLDRARSGTASKGELVRARTHMANCAACRLEQGLLTDIEQATAPRAGDEIVAARIRAFMQRAVAERKRAVPGKRGSARKWATLAFAAALLLATIGAAAALLRERQRSVERATEVVATLPPPSHVAERATQASSASEETKDDPEKIADKAPDESPGARVVPRASRAAPKAERPKVPEDTAAELFARANLLRRRDEVKEAAGVYRELQRAYPGSPEELLSRVVLGRLLLDRLGDAGAALAQFDSYLAAPSQGSLREEALVGRAVALGRLGRAPEERKAWNALLESFPKSTSAARARARIAAIAP